MTPASPPTIQQLIDAIREGDAVAVETMLASRPELARMHVAESDEHQPLHHAVRARQPAIVRLLMRHGADAHAGIWPHRDATTPLTLARDREDDEIVAIIREEESRRVDAAVDVDGAARAQRLDGDPLVRHGAEMTATRAIQTGNLEKLRELHDSFAAAAAPDPSMRHLVSLAVNARRPDVLQFLLDLGYDPDERHRSTHLEDPIDQWGEPLRAAAILGDVAMARMLLERGATPHTNVYAASSAIFEAYSRKHEEVAQLLEQYGGTLQTGDMAYLGLTERARHALDEEARRSASGRASSAEAVLQAAGDTGNVDLVRAALAHVDWDRGDTRWHWMLMRVLGNHDAADRGRYESCLRALLDRSGAAVRGPFGRTLLHDVAGAWPRDATMASGDRLAFATTLLECGARLDVRDDILESTPLGWACRWGRPELVRLLLDHGADPIEADAEPWATPRAWARKSGNREVLSMLES